MNPHQESPAIPPMPKRKPPSQRPEMKKDETAEAIAQARAEARADKEPVDKASRMVSDDLKAGSRGSEPAKATKVAPAPQAKRPKSFG